MFRGIRVLVPELPPKIGVRGLNLLADTFQSIHDHFPKVRCARRGAVVKCGHDLGRRRWCIVRITSNDPLRSSCVRQGWPPFDEIVPVYQAIQHSTGLLISGARELIDELMDLADASSRMVIKPSGSAGPNDPPIVRIRNSTARESRLLVGEAWRYEGEKNFVKPRILASEP